MRPPNKGLLLYNEAMALLDRSRERAIETLKEAVRLGNEDAARALSDQPFAWRIDFFSSLADVDQRQRLLEGMCSSSARFGPELAYRYGYILFSCGCRRIGGYVDRYLVLRDRTKEAVNAWLAIGRRMNLCKDVRRLVGMEVWALRFYFDLQTKPVFRGNRKKKPRGHFRRVNDQ